MSVTSSVSFSPNAQLTRAQIVRILANISGEDISQYTGSSFDDVNAGRWYSEAIEWAYQKGITGGIGDGLFAPDAPVTREQLAVFMYNFIGGEKTSADMSAYTDYKNSSAWARDALCWCVANGIMSGTSATTLSPKQMANRAQTAVLVTNIFS